MAFTERGAVVATILAGLVAGGLAGAGVAFGWYPPLVGVALAALIGLSVGRRALQAKRAPRMPSP